MAVAVAVAVGMVFAVTWRRKSSTGFSIHDWRCGRCAV